ncbi:MAG: replication initiation factor domain-containing protein [Oscillospiraceae bacterium]|nr:replication initiation factor domain-containing protein [Oscillospiraceae bacterium]
MNITYLARIERGEKELTEKMRQRFEGVFDLLGYTVPMDVIYDYVRIRFPFFLSGTAELTQAKVNAKEIIEGLFGIRFEAWEQKPIKRYHYDGMYIYGDFTVLYPSKEDENLGILVELKGRGCRQLENLMVEQGRTWRSFFFTCFEYAPVFKRLDLAINDYFGILSIPELIAKCEDDAYDLKRMRVFHVHKSSTPIHAEVLDEKPPMACTLYLGSRKSDIYFCIYEKDREQEAKLGIAPEDAVSKNRFEVRLHEDRANLALLEILARDNVESVVLDIIDAYVQFFHSVKNKKRPCHRWAQFIGVGRQKIKLTMHPEPYDIRRSYGWMKKQVMSTLKLMAGLEQKLGKEKIREMGLTTLQDMFANAELSDRHERLFGHMTAPMEDILTPAFLQERDYPPAVRLDELVNVKPGEALMIERLFAEANKKNGGN